MHFTISSKNSEIAALSVLRSLIVHLTCSYHQVKQALELLFTSVPNAHKIQKKKTKLNENNVSRSGFRFVTYSYKFWAEYKVHIYIVIYCLF